MSLSYICMIFHIYTVEIPLSHKIVITEIDNVIKMRTQI